MDDNKKQLTAESGVVGLSPIKGFDWILSDDELNDITEHAKKIRDSMPSMEELNDNINKLGYLNP